MRYTKALIKPLSDIILEDDGNGRKGFRRSGAVSVLSRARGSPHRRALPPRSPGANESRGEGTAPDSGCRQKMAIQAGSAGARPRRAPAGRLPERGAAHRPVPAAGEGKAAFPQGRAEACAPGGPLGAPFRPEAGSAALSPPLYGSPAAGNRRAEAALERTL